MRLRNYRQVQRRLHTMEGFNQSGYGKDMSAYWIEDCTVVKQVMASFG